jgi:hypothetical protein
VIPINVSPTSAPKAIVPDTSAEVIDITPGLKKASADENDKPAKVIKLEPHFHNAKGTPKENMRELEWFARTEPFGS